MGHATVCGISAARRPLWRRFPHVNRGQGSNNDHHRTRVSTPMARFLLLLGALMAGLTIWSCTTPSQPDVAVAETSDGLRIEVSSTSASPIGKAEFDLSVVFVVADGRRVGPIDIGLDWGGFRRTNLYRTPEGCLVLYSIPGDVWIKEDTVALAGRGECSRVPVEIRDSCPDPAFDRATRPAHPVGDETGYLGTFEYNMWREGGGERLWLWQFHLAADEPNCLRDAGG